MAHTANYQQKKKLIEGVNTVCNSPCILVIYVCVLLGPSSLDLSEM